MESYNPAHALRTLKIIHFALMGGPVLFSVSAFAIISMSPEAQFIDLNNILSYMPIGFAFMLVPLSFFLFNSTLKENLKGKNELSTKMAAYQTSHIVKIALLEGGALFAVVASFSTYTYANMVVMAFLLGVMFLSTPSIYKIAETLSLSPEESSQLNGSSRL